LKRTIEPCEIPDTWDAESLYNKAQRYVQRMLEVRDSDWEYALWSSFSLELLTRSALSNVNPALVADPENWNNLYYALGFTPTEAKFSPKSIPISEVIKRLGSIVPSFNQELQSFCILHTGRRNAELHSGETPLDGVLRSSWLPRFYQACSVILASMSLDLEGFVGSEEAEVAKKLIDAATDESAKAVRGDVEAHRKVWAAKGLKEQDRLLDGARAFATRSAGHRVACPACGSPALVHGEAITAPTRRLEDGLIIESQDHLPTHFQCVACGLKVLGLSRLSAIGLGDRFITTYSYDAAEYFAPADDMPEYDDDNNEYQ